MSSKKNCVKSKSDEEAIESSKLAFKATLDRMSSSKMVCCFSNFLTKISFYCKKIVTCMQNNYI